jgi:hypothetical protein
VRRTTRDLKALSLIWLLYSVVLKASKLRLLRSVFMRKSAPESMHPRIIFALLGLVTAGLLAMGCQSTEVTKASLEELVAMEAAAAEEPVTETPVEPAPVNSADAATSSNTVAEPAFTPPFPNRLEAFEPPKGSQSTVRRDEEHGESVELKGFINVDQPRVVLSIDGVVSPVPQGGEKYGVQVISIQPPSVVLQRGRARWTATLE